MNTITGRGVDGSVSGEKTLSVRQSSLVGAYRPGPVAVNRRSWTAALPNFVQSRTPGHGATGCASRNRPAPTGGAAKGMAFQLMVPRRASLPLRPPTSPSAVVTMVSMSVMYTNLTNARARW